MQPGKKTCTSKVGAIMDGGVLRQAGEDEEISRSVGHHTTPNCSSISVRTHGGLITPVFPDSPLKTFGLTRQGAV